jgi:hypothetical protein
VAETLFFDAMMPMNECFSAQYCLVSVMPVLALFQISLFRGGLIFTKNLGIYQVPAIRISREQAQNGDAFHVTVHLPDAAIRVASSLKIGFSD